MAQPGEDEKAEQSTLFSTFRCNVHLKSIEEIDMNDDTAECISFSFIHKKSRQIYDKVLKVSDCKSLVQRIPLMPIEGLIKLLYDALSPQAEAANNIQVNWTLSQKKDTLDINVIRKTNDAYMPDITFALSIPSKTMDPMDLLQIRVGELEDENNELKVAMKQQITQLTQTIQNLQIQVAQNGLLYRNAVHSAGDTGMVSDGVERCVVQMELPQKAVRFVCRYSTEAMAAQADTFWIYFSMKLGATVLAPKGGGRYLYNDCQNYAFPLSGSVIVQLNGNETAQQRKLGLYLRGEQAYPAGLKNSCLEAYQIQ
eukprot:187316_1